MGGCAFPTVLVHLLVHANLREWDVKYSPGTYSLLVNRSRRPLSSTPPAALRAAMRAGRLFLSPVDDSGRPAFALRATAWRAIAVDEWSRREPGSSPFALSSPGFSEAEGCAAGPAVARPRPGASAERGKAQKGRIRRSEVRTCATLRPPRTCPRAGTARGYPARPAPLRSDEAVRRSVLLVIRSRAPGRSPQGEGWSP